MTQSRETMNDTEDFQSMLSEGGTLKYDFMTSLYKLAAAKVVINLWMNRNIQQQIINLYHSAKKSKQFVEYCNWSHVKKDIVSKLTQLHLPDSIHKKLTTIVLLVGRNLHNWIDYLDNCVFETGNIFNYSAVDHISYIIWTARGKIDYGQTAKNILIYQDNILSNDHKYILACNHCLEKEINTTAPLVVSLDYLVSIEVDVHPMVYYWTVYVTGYNPKFLTLNYENVHNFRVDNTSFNEHIMQLLLTPFISSRSYVIFNDVPVKYIWNKLTEKEKSKHLTSLVSALDDLDLIYFLLSSLNSEQQEEVLKECSWSLFPVMLKDWLWEEYFLPTVLRGLDIMDEFCCIYLLEMIDEIKCCGNSDEEYVYEKYKALFKLLWQKGCNRFKEFHIKGEKISSKEYVMSLLSWKHQMDIIELIYDNLNLEEKKSIIFGQNGIGKCVNFIKNGEWDLLEQFVKLSLPFEDDVSQLKQRLATSYSGSEIAAHLIYQEDFDKLEYFTKWAMKSEEERILFRMKCSKFCDKKLKYMVTYRYCNFEKLEKYFKWFASNNEILKSNFKSRIPKLYFNTVVFELIIRNRYEFLDEILKWCLTNDQKAMHEFKTCFLRDSYISRYHRKDLIFRLTRKDHSFKSLNKFVSWCFSNKEEIQAFKRNVLHRQNLSSYVPADHVCINDACVNCAVHCVSSNICIDYLSKNEFQLADKFINWCLESNEECVKFKNALMLSRDMRYILREYLSNCKRYSCHDFPKLIRWFNPSNEIATEFHKLFPKEKCPDGFHESLDSFFHNRNRKKIKLQ